MSAVDARIAQLQARNAAAARLAELGCLAVRLEPHLLRRLRRRFLPWSDPSAELDLWHSTLVQSRSATAAVLDVAVQARLRELLSIDAQRHAAYEATRACFEDHPPLQRFEIELNALPVLDPGVSDAAIEAHFGPLLAALRQGGEPARRMATWVLQASARWHPRVRTTAAAWACVIAASAILEGRRVVRGELPAALDPARLGGGLPPALTATRKIGVALTRRKLRFLAAETPGIATIDVIVMSPALLLLEVEGQPTRVIDAQPGTQYDLPDVTRVALRGLLGDGWQIELPSGSARRGEGQDAATSFRARIYARYQTPDTLTLEIHTASRPPRELRLALPDPIVPARMGYLRGWRDDAWSRVGEDTWSAIGFLEDAEIVEVATDERSGSLPWESMPIVGERVLRVPPLLPVKRAPPQARTGAAEALVIDMRGQSSPFVMDLASSIQGQTRSRVSSDARNATSMLFSQRLALLHIAAAGMVRTADGRFGVPIGDSGMLTAREISQIEHAPEMVVLEVPESVDVPWPEGAGSGELVGAFLAAGSRIVVALADAEPGPRLQRAFVDLLYRRLFAGFTLSEAVRYARLETSLRHPSIRPHRFFQVWGDPDAVSSIARMHSLPRRLTTIERSVLEMGSPGGMGPRCTGFWIGNGIVVTAARPLAGIPVIAGSDARRQWQFEADRMALQAQTAAGDLAPEDAELLFAWDASGRSGPIVPLSSALPQTAQPGHVMLRSQADIHLIDVDVVHDAQSEIRVVGITEDSEFPAEIAGAPVLVAGECIGAVIEVHPQQRNALLCAGADRLREGVRNAWRRRIRALLAAHGAWLASDGKDGRRLSVPGVVLSQVDLSNTRLDRADLRKVRMDQVTLGEASLVGANLEGARLDGVYLQGATLTDATLARAKLAGSDARGADFSFADLRGADLARADLRDAILDGARIEGANFEGTDLRGARLAGVSLDVVVGTPVIDPPSTRLRIYLSSTHADLGAEREAARRALAQAGHDVIAWEDHPVTETTPVRQSARMLADCDVVIVVVAWRYGYVSPERESNPSGRSSVELEYEEARRLDKPVLAFLARDRGTGRPSQSDERTGEGQRGALVRQLRDRLARELTVAYFDDAADLGRQVRVAIARLRARDSGKPA